MALEVCQKCKAVCCKMGGPEFTKTEMEKVLRAGYPDYFVKINEDHFELKGKKGICPYLAKGSSCSIHKQRPLMCKCWPVYVDYNDNKRQFILIECPLTLLLSKRDIETMKKQASLVPKELITTSFTSSKLPESDLKIIEKRFNRFKRRPLQ